MRTTRLFRAAVWPLVISSALAAALVVVNPEARRPLRLANRPRRVDHQITSRPTTDSSALLSETVVAKGPSDSEATVPTRSQETAQRLDKSDTDTPRAIPTDVTATADELIRSPRTAPQPTVLQEASREISSPHRPIVSLGPVEKSEAITEPGPCGGESSPGAPLRPTVDAEASMSIATTPASREELSRIEARLDDLQLQINRLHSAQVENHEHAQPHDQKPAQALQRTVLMRDQVSHDNTRRLIFFPAQLKSVVHTGSKPGWSAPGKPADVEFDPSAIPPARTPERSAHGDKLPPVPSAR